MSIPIQMFLVIFMEILRVCVRYCFRTYISKVGKVFYADIRLQYQVST